MAGFFSSMRGKIMICAANMFPRPFGKYREGRLLMKLFTPLLLAVAFLSLAPPAVSQVRGGAPGGLVGPPASVLMGPPAAVLGPPPSVIGPPPVVVGPPPAVVGPPASIGLPRSFPAGLPSTVGNPPGLLGPASN